MKTFVKWVLVLFPVMGIAMAPPGGGMGCSSESGDAGGPVTAPQVFQEEAPCCGVDAQERQAGDPPSVFQSPSDDTVITLAYDANIPQGARDYINSLWGDIEPALRQALGAPSATITVTVKQNGGLWGAAAYYYFGNRVEIKRLPVGDDDETFNGFFTHEMVHAFQDAALERGTVAWATEGIAACATGMVKVSLQGIRSFFLFNWDLDQMATNYDPLSLMGPQSLGGSPSFRDAISPIHAYEAAGGFWWIAQCSQADPGNPWMASDFLARFLRATYDNGRGLGNADARTSMAETAANPIDGESAAAWTATQPIANIQAETGPHLWATMADPFISQYISGLLLFQPFHRYSSGATSYLSGASVHIRAWNLRRQLVWDLERYVGSTGAYQSEFLPAAMKNTHGAYVIEIDATAFGAGIQRLTCMNLPGESWSDYGAERGIGVCFVDPANGYLTHPSFSIVGGSEIGSWSGAHLVRPGSLFQNPSSFSVVYPGKLAERETINVPLPYRRMITLKRRAPTLTE